MVRISRNDDVVERAVAGELFLVPIRSSLADLQELFVLNDTGRWIWERLAQGSCASEDLVSGLIAEFEVDEETALRDLEIFARQLTDAGLARAQA